MDWCLHCQCCLTALSSPHGPFQYQIKKTEWKWICLCHLVTTGYRIELNCWSGYSPSKNIKPSPVSPVLTLELRRSVSACCCLLIPSSSDGNTRPVTFILLWLSLADCLSSLISWLLAGRLLHDWSGLKSWHFHCLSVINHPSPHWPASAQWGTLRSPDKEIL